MSLYTLLFFSFSPEAVLLLWAITNEQGLHFAFLYCRSVLMALTHLRPLLKSWSDKLNWQGNKDAIKLHYHHYHKMHTCPQGNTQIIKGNRKLQHKTWKLWNWGEHEVTQRNNPMLIKGHLWWSCAIVLSVVHVLFECAVTIKMLFSKCIFFFCFALMLQ